jgi:MFS family permease
LAGAEIRRFSADRRGGGANGLLATGAGAIGSLAEVLILPPIVLAFFAGQLTDSYAAVGLVSAIAVGFWAIARIPAGLLVAVQRRKQPWALAGILVRAVALALLAFVAFRGAASGDDLLRSFFICLAAYALASGFASVPLEALVAKAVPNAARASFYRQRALWGIVAALGGALVVAQLFKPGGPSFPRQYALLFLAATVCQVAIAVFLASVREPLRVSERRPSVLPAIQGVPAALADRNFRRFLFFRLLLALTAAGDPFLIIFAFARLGASAGAVGGYVLAFVLGILMSQPVWVAVAHRAGERASLQAAALLRLVPPLLALVLPSIASTTLWRDRFGGQALLEIVFGVAFWCIGASTSAQARGTFGYLAEFAPFRLRAAYTFATNAGLAVAAFAPVAAGLLVERAGFDGLFLIAALVGVVAVFASGALPNTYVRLRSRRVSRPESRAAGTTTATAIGEGA